MKMEEVEWQNIYYYDQLWKILLFCGLYVCIYKWAQVLKNQKIFGNYGARNKSSLCQKEGFGSETITSFSSVMFLPDLDLACASYLHVQVIP